jgi:hypothetical protein
MLGVCADGGAGESAAVPPAPELKGNNYLFIASSLLGIARARALRNEPGHLKARTCEAAWHDWRPSLPAAREADPTTMATSPGPIRAFPATFIRNCLLGLWKLQKHGRSERGHQYTESLFPDLGDWSASNAVLVSTISGPYLYLRIITRHERLSDVP